ncbi:hypothetical protein L195_g005665 [Trifolium pratense]|uniref:Uncharacterized protein n=1 Tax=Trifolium pratense TaxID=57577 RepID=A0A2K3P1F4_TRIPR|nr:hypothetical protein L195_g005665 [Trifolium pratense]
MMHLRYTLTILYEAPPTGLCLQAGHPDHRYFAIYGQQTTLPIIKRSSTNLAWRSNIIIPYFIISIVPYTPKQRSHSTYSSVILMPTQGKHSIGRTTLLTSGGTQDKEQSGRLPARSSIS